MPGDTVIVPDIEEIMTVERRVLLREDTRVRRREVVKHTRHPVQLRSEEVSLERHPLYPNVNLQVSRRTRAFVTTATMKECGAR